MKKKNNKNPKKVNLSHKTLQKLFHFEREKIRKFSWILTSRRNPHSEKNHVFCNNKNNLGREKNVYNSFDFKYWRRLVWAFLVVLPLERVFFPKFLQFFVGFEFRGRNFIQILIQTTNYSISQPVFLPRIHINIFT